jgi:small GTP-binding protein
MPSSLDTAGTEQFGQPLCPLRNSTVAYSSSVAMRDLYMKTGQGFLLVFSITSRASLQELATLRDEIIRIKDDENIPIVIVGNKADLVDQRQVDRAKAFSISQQWQAPYYEASARTRSRSSLSCTTGAFIDILPPSQRRRGFCRPLPADVTARRRSGQLARFIL